MQRLTRPKGLCHNGLCHNGLCHKGLSHQGHSQAPRWRQSGGALMITVLGLGVAGLAGVVYASRSAMTEHRTTLLQWRTLQATQAAEAGLGWAVTALNAGRLSFSCQPTPDATAKSLAGRLLQIDPLTRKVQPTSANGLTAGAVSQRPRCQAQDSGWACRCPADGTQSVTASTWVPQRPGFEVHAEAVATVNTVRLQAVGCSGASTTCFQNGSSAAPDAAAWASVMVGLVPHLRVRPTAAVTATGDVRMALPAAAPWTVTNDDSATSGVAVRAGGAVDITASNTGLTAPVNIVPTSPLQTANGTLASVSVQDNWLGTQSSSTLERRFATWMGVLPAVFQRLSSVTSIDCPAQGCSDALLRTVALKPAGAVWVRGILRIERSVSVGSLAEPVLIVAEGGVALDTPTSEMIGVVVLPQASATLAGPGTLTGALIALGHVTNQTGQGVPSIRYDGTIVSRAMAEHGEWVRVPGGWRDYGSP